MTITRVASLSDYAQLGRQEEMQAVRDQWFEVIQKRFGRQPLLLGQGKHRENDQ